MPIDFNLIPSNLRTPGVYVEQDASRALRGLPQFNSQIYVIGQKLAAGTQAENTPTLVSSVQQAMALFGRGSQLAHMVETIKKNTKFVEVYGIAMDDEAGGTQAVGTITVSAGTASENGTIFLYIAGRRLSVPVVSGQDQDAIAGAIIATINADLDLPVTALVDGVNANEVDVTARHKGTVGNAIDMRVNHLGLESGEVLPAGVALTIVQMATGATDPDIQGALDVLPEEIVNFVLVGTNVSAEIAKVETVMTDRWGPTKMFEGMAFSAVEDTVSNLTTYGNARNNEFVTIVGFNDSPTPFYEVASAYCAQIALAGTIDPARPFQTLKLEGVLAPPKTSQFTQTERNTLLFDGVAMLRYSDTGAVLIDRAITTYQKNVANAPDASYLDVNTILTLAYLRQSARVRLLLKFPRHKIVDNGTRFGAGQAILTPNVIKMEMVALFKQWEEIGLVENAKQFKEELIVERDGADVNRVNILMPPDLANQLRIMALQFQFLL